METLKPITAFVAWTFLVALCLQSCCNPAEARPAPKPKAICVRCQDKCEPCVDLVKELKRQGVTLRFETAPDNTKPASWYPAVEYSDGVVDWGIRVYDGKCTYPDVLPVIKHKQEE